MKWYLEILRFKIQVAGKEYYIFHNQEQQAEER